MFKIKKNMILVFFCMIFYVKFINSECKNILAVEKKVTSKIEVDVKNANLSKKKR